MSRKLPCMVLKRGSESGSIPLFAYRWPEWIKLMNNNRLTHSMSKKAIHHIIWHVKDFLGNMKNEMFYGKNQNNVSIESFIIK